jgi:thiol-disulfide isomerase/thioredoxin
MKIFYLINLLLLTTSQLVSAAEVGQIPPSCNAVEQTSSQKIDINAYQGKVLLIDFWATWCPPCKNSMPFLNKLRNLQQKNGFEILAINVDENIEEAKSFLTQNPVDYKMAFDPEGDCPQKFAVKAMPSSYLIDKTGKIRLVHLGFRDEDQKLIEEQVSSLLGE